MCQRGEGIKQGHTECLTSPALSLAASLAVEPRSTTDLRTTDALSSSATVSCVSRRAEDKCCGRIKQRTLVSLLAKYFVEAMKGLLGRVGVARDGVGDGVGGRFDVFPDQCQ